jgi:hypothetical protein
MHIYTYTHIRILPYPTHRGGTGVSEWEDNLLARVKDYYTASTASTASIQVPYIASTASVSAQVPYLAPNTHTHCTHCTHYLYNLQYRELCLPSLIILSLINPL